MEALIPTLALLACPIGMGLMMWFMMRGSKGGSAHSGDRSASIADLGERQRRIAAEIDRLEDVQAEGETPSGDDRPRLEVDVDGRISGMRGIGWP